ncbi:MAG: MBOAT family O-acyltransferase [Gemmiger sp.]
MFTKLYFLPALAVSVVCWYLTPPKRRWGIALVFSAVFYLLLNAAGLPWLLLSTAFVWLSARQLASAQGTVRRIWLLLGASGALLPFVCLKYVAVWAATGWAAPLGISYYSLQLAGYLFDVEKGRIAPERRYARLLCYAMFFLSIVQGPFNHYDALMLQMEQPLRANRQRITFGLQRMAWGYFQKLAVADRLGPVVDSIFANYTVRDSSQLIFGVVAYSIQLYADFAGYTDIALGAGELFGLTLPENFGRPYLAQSAPQFWRRWHMSLSFWFRDYVYIPLGGNRCSLGRQMLNLLAVWVLTGLWHGAGSSFVAWGLYWFLVLAASRLLFRRRQKPGNLLVQILRAVRTCCIAGFGWLLFRADSLAQAADYIRCALTSPGHRVFTNYWEMRLTSRYELLMLFAGIAAVVLVDALHARGHHLRRELAAQKMPVRWAVYQCALWAFLFMGVFLSSDSGSFLYARF